MWTFTKDGFFSVVVPRRGAERRFSRSGDVAEGGVLAVRARDRESLVRLCDRLRRDPGDVERGIVPTPERDYPFRVYVTRAQWSAYLAKCVDEALDYENFKDAVRASRGHAFAGPLMDCWAALRRLQDGGEQPNVRRPRRGDK